MDVSPLVHLESYNHLDFLRSLTSRERAVLNQLDCGHYYCRLWSCLRYRIALERSAVIIAQLKLVLATGLNIVNHSVMHWSKCYVIGREFNNGGFGRKCHLHIYVKLDLKMKLTEFKEKMTAHGLRVDDIQTCKNVPAAIRYVTKEDRIPFNCGVDWSKLNWLCKLKVIAEQMEFIDNTHPAVVSIPHVYRSTFRNYHSQFWDEINRGLLFDVTDEPVDIDKYYRIKGFFEMDWLGVYVYGAPGVGKSLTTLYLSKFDVFYVNMNSVRFALSGYHGEPVILFDEIEDYGQWRHLLLSLGGKLPFAYDVKGCNPRIMYPHKLKKVVLTSNMPYDAFTQDGAFRRRYIRCPMDPR